MITLWFLFLIIFAQAYILLALQAVGYGKRIRVLHEQTQQREELAYSFFLHLARIIIKGGKVEEKFEVKTKQFEGVLCYATIKKEMNQRFVITITTIDQKNIKTIRRGVVAEEEESSFSISFLEGVDNNT